MAQQQQNPAGDGNPQQQGGSGQSGQGGQGGGNGSGQDKASGEARDNRPNCIVEFGNVYSQTITLNALKLRVRGRFSIPAMAQRPEGMRDLGHMNRMPEIPGLQMALYSRRQRYKLFDPLEKNKTLLDQINAVAKSAPAALRGADWTHVPSATHDCDEDEWKTLLLELIRKERDGYLRVVEGTLPGEKDIDKMPGERLAEPWNNSHNKPRYHKDLRKYRESIDSRV